MQPFSRPKSLTELVAEHLRAAIVGGDLDLGSHLSEARIAKDLNVSRTPVREAINRLEMEGLLTIEPQRGTFVFSLEQDELAKLCDARVCLESAALSAAIDLRPDELAASLADCTDSMTRAREAGEDSAYLALDAEFHQAFFDAADNRFLTEAYQVIAPKMSALRNRLGRHPDHMAKSYAEHLAILAAVQKRDAGTALKILSMHIDRKEGSYWQIASGTAET